MNRGDVVVLRADKLYEPYGKSVPYYLVTEKRDLGLVLIYDPILKDSMLTFESDLILISKCKREKNF